METEAALQLQVSHGIDLTVLGAPIPMSAVIQAHRRLRVRASPEHNELTFPDSPDRRSGIVILLLSVLSRSLHEFSRMVNLPQRESLVKGFSERVVNWGNL